MVGRDFNCRIHFDGENQVPSVGKYAHSEHISDNGERLVLLAQEKSVKVVNSFFLHNELKSTRWNPPVMKRVELLDYFLVRSENMNKIKDVQSKHRHDYGSDHDCVVFYLKTKKI